MMMKLMYGEPLNTAYTKQKYEYPDKQLYNVVDQILKIGSKEQHILRHKKQNTMLK